MENQLNRDCSRYKVVEEEASGGSGSPVTPWKKVDLQSENVSGLNPFKSPDQGQIHGPFQFVGRSGIGRDSFVGPVIDNVGLLKCPGCGNPDGNDLPLQTYEVLVIDPARVRWVPVGENGSLARSEDTLVTQIPQVYVGRRRDHGIGMVRWANGAYVYYSWERSQPYSEDFEILCIKRN